MTRPVCWSKSWRLTPRMKTRCPLTSRSRPRISTRRKPTRTRRRLDDRRRPASRSDDRQRRRGSGCLRRPARDVRERRGASVTEPVERRRHAGGGAASQAGSSSARQRPPAAWRYMSALVVERPALERPAVDAARRRRGAARSTPVERRLDRPARPAARRPGTRPSTVRSSVPVVRSSARPAIAADVGEVDRLGRVQVDRAGDPAVPPLVLVLDVGRVGPLHDASGAGCWRPAGRRSVMSNSEARCESLLTPISSPLSADDEHALGGADVEHDPPAGPGRRDLERRARRRRSGSTSGIVRRQARERHLDVRVVRLVPGVLASSSSPGPRSRASVGVDRIVRSAEELEAPRAVEREPVVVADAVHREAADARQLRARPRVGHARDCRTGRDRLDDACNGSAAERVLRGMQDHGRRSPIAARHWTIAVGQRRLSSADERARRTGSTG